MIEILNQTDSDLIGTLDKKERKKIMQMMVFAIMSTDMQRHFQFIEEFKEKKHKFSRNDEDKKVRSTPLPNLLIIYSSSTEY